jgi:hypothetical protein
VKSKLAIGHRLGNGKNACPVAEGTWVLVFETHFDQTCAVAGIAFAAGGVKTLAIAIAADIGLIGGDAAMIDPAPSLAARALPRHSLGGRCGHVASCHKDVASIFK